MYPTRGRGPRFPQAYMPNRSCQEDGWDRPKQNWYPDGPGRGQFYNSRANGDNFGQYRGSYRGRGWRRPRSDFPEERHYRGHSYRRSKTSFTKGRYQHASRPPCLKTISLKNSQTAEVSSSHTSPVPPAKTPTEQTSSIKKDPHNMGKEPVSMRERHSAAAESSANQTHPVPFPEAPLHAPEYTEELHAKAKEKYVLCEVRQSRDRLGDVISPVAVEIPFLFENTDDHQSEGKEAIERCEVKQSRDRLGDVISPVAVEIPFLSENTDGHQSEGKEAIERCEVKQSRDQLGDVISPVAVEIPFLSENTDGHQSEGKEAIERCEVKQSRDQLGDVISPVAVEIPFLSENTDGHQSEGKEAIERLEVRQSRNRVGDVISPVAVEIPFLSGNTDGHQSEGKEAIEQCEVRQSRNRVGDVISPVAVEIPFLYGNTDGHQSEGKEAIERTIQMKWRYSEAAKSSANQTLPIPPPEAPVEEQTTLETTERRPTAKQNSILPPQSLQMKERDRDSESAESSANQTQPILSSEAPVEEQTTPETTEHHSTVKQNSILKQPTVLRDETCIQHAPPEEGEGATNQAPNDNSVKTPSTGSHKEASPGQKDLGLTGFPLNFSSIHYVPVLVQKAEMQLLSSHSLPQTHVICDRKCDIERLLVCHSCSSRIHHSSASEYSSQNCVPREFCILRSRSPHRQEQELRSDHKKKQKLGSFCRQEQSLKSSRKCKPSPHRRKQHSGSPQRRSDYVGSCYHCYCDYKYDCSLSQENPKESDLSPRYLPHKINNCHSPKERSEKVSHLNSPASHTVKAKKEKVMQPEEMAKKKRSSSGKGTKFIKIQKTVSNYEDTTSPQHPNTEEKTSSSAISWTLKDRSADVLAKEEIEEIQTTASNYEVQGSPQHPNTEEKTSSSDISWTLKDRSAAVLAKKEEIEEAYLRVLLNFAVMAIMLVEKEPSMETTIGSALRANLRRTGDYYEHMLKNYIDSLAEPS
ncbi:uncharacterized protein [Anolis sagrei]|uniref:uncharacterized protein isoform X3 n=1 Tax=Anolis sagrei TaxID=38937 RepID=UPI003522EAA9